MVVFKGMGRTDGEEISVVRDQKVKNGRKERTFRDLVVFIKNPAHFLMYPRDLSFSISSLESWDLFLKYFSVKSIYFCTSLTKS